MYIDVFETPSESRKQDHYVHKNLMLAKALGAEIKVLYAQDIAKALTDWCNLAFCDEASPDSQNSHVGKITLNSHSLNKLITYHTISS